MSVGYRDYILRTILLRKSLVVVNSIAKAYEMQLIQKLNERQTLTSACDIQIWLFAVRFLNQWGGKVECDRMRYPKRTPLEL